MTHPKPNISVNVDVTNPGQFFACCGLFELADRLWPGVEGWFAHDSFRIATSGNLPDLVSAIVDAKLEQTDPGDDMASPMQISAPFEMYLDWWTDEFAGGKRLKVWAGSMRNVRIARAMQSALKDIELLDQMFNHAAVVFDPDQPKKKVEPYYFDARRGQAAQSIDIGFAPDSLRMKTLAYPAVELGCLVGLQRFRPAETARRVFQYGVWHDALPVIAASIAASGTARANSVRAYRFENAFRTAQRKHKSFLSATPIGTIP